MMKSWDCNVGSADETAIASATRLVVRQGGTFEKSGEAYRLTAPSNLTLLCLVRGGFIVTAAVV